MLLHFPCERGREATTSVRRGPGAWSSWCRQPYPAFHSLTDLFTYVLCFRGDCWHVGTLKQSWVAHRNCGYHLPSEPFLTGKSEKSRGPLPRPGDLSVSPSWGWGTTLVTSMLHSASVVIRLCYELGSSETMAFVVFNHCGSWRSKTLSTGFAKDLHYCSCQVLSSWVVSSCEFFGASLMRAAISFMT